MPEIVAFSAPDDDREAVIRILEDALEKARAGQLKDVAVVGALHDEDGPQHWFRYYGEGAYALLVAAVQGLAFDLQYRRYEQET